MIYTDEMAAMLKRKAGEKWRPSNGTEGDMFTASMCRGCATASNPDTMTMCEIEGSALCFGVDEPEYPQEWQIGQDGQPTCTAFKLRADLSQ